MVRIPARCGSCGHAFPSGFNIGDGTTVQTAENIQNCPRCGEDANIMDGHFRIDSGGIELLSGPQWSWDLVEELGLTLRRIVEDPPADPIAPIAQISPQLGRDLRRVRDKRDMTTRELVGLIADILAILGAVGGAATAVATHPELAREIMERIAELFSSRYGLG